MTRARDLANIADGTFTATDLDLSGTLTVSGDATFDTNTLFVDVSANAVGVGTTSPASELHVKSSGTSSDTLTIENSTGNGSWRVKEGGSSNALLQGYNASNSETIRLDPTSDTFFNGGNVGIGTSSPSAGAIGGKVLHVQNSGGNASVRVDRSDAATAGTLSLTSGNTSNSLYSTGSKPLDFYTDSALATRIDSSGVLYAGKSAQDISVVGHELHPQGFVFHTRANAEVLYLRRNSSDGAIQNFYRDGSLVGVIGSQTLSTNPELFIGNGSNIGLAFEQTGSDRIFPCSGSTGAEQDATIDLGASSARFVDAFIINGVTTGSDGRDKQDIEELDETERRVAVACKGLLRKWRWKDAVAEKGDEARIHFGIIAQDLQAAFEAEGLDAGRYGMFMYNEWTDKETGEERSRMGVRYSELLAFIIAAL